MNDIIKDRKYYVKVTNFYTGYNLKHELINTSEGHVTVYSGKELFDRISIMLYDNELDSFTAENNLFCFSYIKPSVEVLTTTLEIIECIS